MTIWVRLCSLVALAACLGRPALAADCVGNLTLDFSDNSLSPYLTTAADPPCSGGTVTATGGELVISRPSGIGTNCANAAHLATPYEICGDFDIQVDFNLVDFGTPDPGRTRYATLIVSNRLGGGYYAIERQITSAGLGCRPFANMYKIFQNTGNDCLASYVATTQTVGKLRITRQGSTWRSYYWDGASWALAGTVAGSMGGVGVGLYTGGDNPATQQVRFDNITITSTTTCASLSDDFNDNALAPLWVDVSDGGCGSISESGGTINLSKSGGCVGFAVARLNDTKVLCGDFDVWIDYTLSMPTASSAGGSIHGLQLRVFNTGELVAGAERYRQIGHCAVPHNDSYKFYTTFPGCPPDANYHQTTDQIGKLRFKRTGSTIEGFYADPIPIGWVQGMIRPITTEPLYLQLNSGTNQSQTAATQGTFDNLNINYVGVEPDAFLGARLVARVAPNPARGSAAFALYTGAAGIVDVDIVDVTGRRTAPVWRGWRPSGAWQHDWNGRGLDGTPVPAGIYFIRIRSNGHSTTNRFAWMP